MNLFEFINTTKQDYDTYDDVYDASVTVCFIEEDDSDNNEFYYYNKFCNDIIKLVEVIKKTNNCIVVAKWTDLIKRNIKKFKKFTKKYWHNHCQYADDEDEFIYQWINEIHNYMAGNVSLDFYKTLVDFVCTLK